MNANLMIRESSFVFECFGKSFQTGITDYVNKPENLGVSTINTPIKNRPKVKDELKNLLKMDQPINYVPCGN